MERRMSVNELAAYLGLSRATVWLRCKRHNIIPTPDPDNLRVHLFDEAQIRQFEQFVRKMRRA